MGSLSGSATSVSGPAAGLTAIVAAQIATLGSFEAFLFAVLIAGLIQIGLGLAKAGAISAFVPGSVIKGLLAAIGVILILKQIPHLFGHDTDPEGEMSFRQPDQETTFSGLGHILSGEIHAGAMVVGLFSIAVLLLWEKWKPLKNSIVPGQLVVVLLGVAINLGLREVGGRWWIEESHLVQIPIAESAGQLLGFLQFAVKLLAIVFTDLLVGILIGLAVSALFILNSNLRSPVRRIVETHRGGEILHIELANQVSFLNRAALAKILAEAPRGSNVLIDATDTDYMDPDALSLIRDFKETKAPAHGVAVSLRGFRDHYDMSDEVEFADYSTLELREQLTPQQVLDLLREGNRRFRTGHRLSRDFNRQINATAGGQNPMAVVLSCIDSRVPVELVFDLGIGDVFSVRVAGNVLGARPLGSIEYGVAVAGVRLVLVMGHTRCGAVTSSVRFLCSDQDPNEATGCEHLHSIVDEIGASLDRAECGASESRSPEEREAFIDEVSRRHVLRTVRAISERSEGVRKAVEQGRVKIVGALYDVTTGEIRILPLESDAVGEPESGVVPELPAA